VKNGQAIAIDHNQLNPLKGSLKKIKRERRGETFTLRRQIRLLGSLDMPRDSSANVAGLNAWRQPPICSRWCGRQRVIASNGSKLTFAASTECR